MPAKAFYTRYPRGIEGDVAEDLRCPKCASEEIAIVKEIGTGSYGMLGDSAQCWICRHEFTVTGNCWHERAKEPWTDERL